MQEVKPGGMVARCSESTWRAGTEAVVGAMPEPQAERKRSDVIRIGNIRDLSDLSALLPAGYSLSAMQLVAWSACWLAC
jgi:hypothetical protein